VTVADQPPVAAFTSAPGSPTTGQAVAFDATGSNDPDGTVSTYAWNFGDGATDTTNAAKPSHVYAAAGTYTVELTVTDNDGNADTVKHDVTVTQSTSTPGPGGSTTNGTGQSSTAGGSSALGSPAPSPPGVLPATGARLTIPAQSLKLSTSRATGVLVRCGVGSRCAGKLTLSVTVPASGRRGSRARTVVLGTARFSVAALHAVTVRFHLGRVAATLLNGHRRIRVHATAAVANAVSGRASVVRSVWLARGANSKR
jgi:PKD repeat protein